MMRTPDVTLLLLCGLCVAGIRCVLGQGQYDKDVGHVIEIPESAGHFSNCRPHLSEPRLQPQISPTAL